MILKKLVEQKLFVFKNSTILSNNSKLSKLEAQNYYLNSFKNIKMKNEKKLLAKIAGPSTFLLSDYTTNFMIQKKFWKISFSLS